MCQAFSALVTKHNKVYWKEGVDSHEDLRELFKKDKDLKDNKELPENTFARVEINPANGDYLKPDKWVYKIDERIKPDWITKKHEQLTYKALEKWKKKVYTFNVKEAINLIHPFKIKASKITKKHIELVRQWASVWASVWNSVWNSVGNSVWNSVWAYTGSLFPIKKWKYVDYRKKPFNKIKDYPFQSAVKLWKMGLVASYDGSVWRLHGSPKGNGEIEVLWEGKL